MRVTLVQAPVRKKPNRTLQFFAHTVSRPKLSVLWQSWQMSLIGRSKSILSKLLVTNFLNVQSGRPFKKGNQSDLWDEEGKISYKITRFEEAQAELKVSF